MPRVQFVRDSYSASRSRDKSYARSYEVFADGVRLAHCDRHGHIEAGEQVIVDSSGRSYFSRPNRKLMPSRWTLCDEAGSEVGDIERASLATAFNPLSRDLFKLRDRQLGGEYHLKTLTESKLDRLLSGAVADLYLVEGDQPRAAFYRKALDANESAPKSLREKLRSFFKPTYWALRSDSDEHVISAPLFLLLVMLCERMANSSN